MTEKLSDIKLFQLATAAREATETECAKFPPFEGLALSIQLKKSAKAAVAQIEEAYGRFNAGDRIRLLGLSSESIETVLKGLDSSLKSKLIKQPECEKLKSDWAAVAAEIETYTAYLEAGGEMESPLPGV